MGAGIDHAVAVGQPGGLRHRGRGLGHRHRFAGQRRFGHLQLRRLQQACVGGHRVAGGQQQHVARHQLARLQQLLDAVAPHAHLQRRQLAQRGHRAFGPAFLVAADQRVDDHHRQDHPGVAQVAQRHRQAGGDEQDGHQRALQLAQEHPPGRPRGAARAVRWGRVGQALAGGGSVEPALGVAVQRLHGLPHRQRVPVGA
jgi:hypothetical protein